MKRNTAVTWRNPPAVFSFINKKFTGKSQSFALSNLSQLYFSHQERQGETDQSAERKN